MLEFKLRGSLQSWGLPKVKGDFFPTDTKPTKSGVIGLIACVLGFERGDPRIDELDKALDIWVYSYPNEGIMTDFHLIHVSDERPQYLASGAKSSGPQANSIITYRSYIQDGEFDVYLDGDRVLLERIYEAFRCPHWIPYLGRKACAVSYPILPEWVDVMAEMAEKLR